MTHHVTFNVPPWRHKGTSRALPRPQAQQKPDQRTLNGMSPPRHPKARPYNAVLARKDAQNVSGAQEGGGRKFQCEWVAT